MEESQLRASRYHAKDARDRKHMGSRSEDQYRRHRNHPYRKIKNETQEGYETQESRRKDARRQDRWRNPLTPDRHGVEFRVAEKTDSSQTENKPKEKPNFQLSGKLTEDTNTYRGVVIKYNEPPEARKPKKRWRLYPFKNDEALQVLHIHRQSAYLIGRDRLVADIPVDHPSCSKQHAVLQYRMVDLKREDGTVGKRVAPYIIDLDSSNGTYVNNVKIEPRRYVELFEKDVIKFGCSSRDFVLLHEMSDASDAAEDEVVESP
ncbi:hypothetical protein CHS0354_000229 [Potamilus streckersoni]|uniref:FHA domain-containing protein n=1 Tax=Potamilus streckersoni TaxID=2493646 RepID=A0AAE0RQV6_9BIVA|nr:hypothetical protein CHS0354_000229 [Potamilus streckersoni]